MAFMAGPPVGVGVAVRREPPEQLGGDDRDDDPAQPRDDDREHQPVDLEPQERQQQDRRYQLHAGRAQGQHHHHRVGRRVVRPVELLQLFHGLDAERGGRIPQAEHVGRERERDHGERRVIARHLGEQRPQDRLHQLDQAVNDAGVLADLEQSQEQRDDPDEPERDLGAGLGEVERGRGDGVELDESDRVEDHPGRAAAR
jgi:hypothetical protein